MTDVTPEEKLLHLIRVGEKESRKKEKAGPPARLSFNKQAIFGVLKNARWLHPQSIVFFAFFLSAVFLGYTFLFPYKPKESAGESTQNVSLKGTDNAAGQALKEPVTKEAFLAEVSKRDVFESHGGASEAAAGSASNQTTSEAFKDLNLIAVIDEKNPQAVIENKKAQKVFYVRQGDSIDAFQIEKVTSGRVTLSYRGEKYDLTL